MKRLVVIDGKSVFYRGYYAMPNLSTGDGTPTGGVYGFAAMSMEVLKKLKPDYVAVAWDKPKTNIRKRLELYPEYKAGRKPAPPDFYEQIPILHELLQALGWPLYELDDYEADDIMATLARLASEQGIETCLITSDLDALQVVGPLTHVYALKKGFSQIDMFDVAGFESKYGIRVDQFLDLKSLKGDSSDNIPGVPGVGEKTALDLLQRYGTLDNIYENLWEVKDSLRRKLEDGKASAYLSRSVAELWTDAPVPLDLADMAINDFDPVRLKTILTKLEFRSLLRNLPKFMQTDQSVENETANLVSAKSTELDIDSLQRAKKIVVWTEQDKWYVSTEPRSYSLVSLEQLAVAGGNAEWIVHDGKLVCKYILRRKQKTPKMIHDTKHAAFLIDPLRKSRELSDMMGVDESNPGQVVAAIWELLGEQTAEFEKMPKLGKLAREIDFALIPVLARMEYRGILLDTDFLADMDKLLVEEISQAVSAIYDIAGYEFNIASPQQLSEVLFVKLQMPTVGIKKGKTGYSTGQKELDKLRGLNSIIELIEKYRELTKLQNTYVQALPRLVDDQSRIHTTFNQDVAATGRLSSTDPNLQNIPVRSDIGKRIREAFIPAEGNVFVSADYSQFELRLAAVLAGDQPLIDDFNAGVDVHAKTAADVYAVPIEQVTKNQRRDAKVINFGVLYGMSPHGLAAATGMTFGDAKAFIDEYFRLRAPIRIYIDQTIARAKSDGYVETYYGRRRPTPDIRSSNFIVRQAAERAAANMPIQGTEADLMKMAMLKIEQEIDGFGVQVLQIHDSVLVECPEGNEDKVKEILRDCMENICPELGIKLSVDTRSGINWGEA
ncbi:DNA polymerase I [Candidatus Saccharibacteria bacterium]|nr:DNA polymerase I [Candidatus Saccharibacteria bacterium]NCU40751.1 DNA polymerase I [Candidatus Saccharibacteria bacterium]